MYCWWRRRLSNPAYEMISGSEEPPILKCMDYFMSRGW